MKSLKLKNVQDLDAGIKALTGPNPEEILYTFEVVPMDYRIKDYSTPKLLLTQTKLFFTHDDLLEMYELAQLEIDVTKSPKLELWEILLEGNYRYTPENEEQLTILKTDENLPRLSISEPNAVSKEFVLRKWINVEKSYKTWAMGRIIMNTKLGMTPNPILDEMLDGYFSVLNQKTVIAFAGSFITYFVLKSLSLAYLPSFINTILDIILGVMLIFMTWWLYSSATHNLKRYKNVYLSYKA